MTGIKMDPVSERIEDFTTTGENFLKWVEVYVGTVAMYTGITLANKIKMVIPGELPVQPFSSDSFKKPCGFVPYLETVIKYCQTYFKLYFVIHD